MLASLASCAVCAVPALAGTTPAPAATCPGQTFSQVFEAYGDVNFYTLAPGGEFNSASEGWSFYNGAKIVQAARPGGASGGVLDLPSGSFAVSAPVCVTLQYPTARLWLRDAKGVEGVAVAVAYPGTLLTLSSPQSVGQFHGQQTSWTLSSAFNVQPQIGLLMSEAAREARFVFTNSARNSEVDLYGLYVDPRMR